MQNGDGRVRITSRFFFCLKNEYIRKLSYFLLIHKRRSPFYISPKRFLKHLDEGIRVCITI